MYNCQGGIDVSTFISALDWIASPNNDKRDQPGVISFSSYVPPWDSANFQALGDAAARTVTATNFPLFSSADNWSTDACLFSPKDRAYTSVNRNGTVFVAGGTSVTLNPDDPNDYRWQTFNEDGSPARGNGSGSNAGACVSIYAPGAGIYVAQNYSTDSAQYGTYDGTSFVAPVVAGVAARYIEQQKQQTGITPSYSQVYDFLLSQAVTSFQWEITTPTYWVCVNVNPDYSFTYQTYTSNPGTCPGFNRGPIQFPQVGNSSNARMVYWNNGSCP